MRERAAAAGAVPGAEGGAHARERAAGARAALRGAHHVQVGGSMSLIFQENPTNGSVRMADEQYPWQHGHRL